MNLLEAKIADGGALIGDYLVPIDRGLLAKAGDDKTLTIGVRPEALHFADEGLPVTVAVVEELGSDAFLYGTAEHTDEPADHRPDRHPPAQRQGHVVHLARTRRSCTSSPPPPRSG
jgi:multiple sugar transport system ATP-binding protein